MNFMNNTRGMTKPAPVAMSQIRPNTETKTSPAAIPPTRGRSPTRTKGSMNTAIRAATIAMIRFLAGPVTIFAAGSIA